MDWMTFFLGCAVIAASVWWIWRCHQDKPDDGNVDPKGGGGPGEEGPKK